MVLIMPEMKNILKKKLSGCLITTGTAFYAQRIKLV